MSTPATPVPDDKDWTHVVTDGCAACGFDASYEVSTTGERLRGTVPRWRSALERHDAAARPAPTTWSPLEYACHVRDVCALFRTRLELMLTDDDARFANWDQDETALAERYWEQHATVVAGELEAQALATAAAFDEVSGPDWDRVGTRSNGSVFTVRTFAAYFLHDVEHHLHDVAG